MQEILSVVERGIIGKPLWMRGAKDTSGPILLVYEKKFSGGGPC